MPIKFFLKNLNFVFKKKKKTKTQKIKLEPAVRDRGKSGTRHFSAEQHNWHLSLHRKIVSAFHSFHAKKNKIKKNKKSWPF